MAKGITSKTTSKTTNNKARSSRRKTAQINTSKAASSICLAEISALTYEQIAELAKEIWQTKGCVPGCDEQNWYEAETQLREKIEAH